MPERPLRLIAATAAVAASLLVAIPAIGQDAEPATTFRMSPNVAGQGSRLIVDAQNLGSAGGPRITSTVLGLQRGFELDVRARTGRCTPAHQAQRRWTCVESHTARRAPLLTGRWTC